MLPYNLALELTPAALRHIIDCVSPEKHKEPLVGTDRFNLTEMVAHMADSEDFFLDRMVLAHEQPGSTVEAFDAEERAKEKGFSERNLQHELDVFENRRHDTITFLKSLPEESWSKTVIHSELGEMSIAQMVANLTGHDLYHIEQAGQYLR